MFTNSASLPKCQANLYFQPKNLYEIINTAPLWPSEILEGRLITISHRDIASTPPLMSGTRTRPVISNQWNAAIGLGPLPPLCPARVLARFVSAGDSY
jgi:hypothetical protein